VWQRLDRHGVATQALVGFVVGALFPRLAYIARWPTRLEPRGLVAYAAFNTSLGFVLRQFVAPRLGARGEHVAEVTRQLRLELGREPTPIELGERLGLEPPGR
jgi:hypothetical protein